MIPWLHLGPLSLPSYGLLGATGFLIMAYMSKRDAKRDGLDPENVIDVIAWASMAGLLGTRMLFLWQNPTAWRGPLSLVDLRQGGLVFYGALLAIPVVWWRIRVHRLPVWRVLDAIARNLPLGHAIARLGCFMAGCCYGIPTQMPWAVHFTHPDTLAPRNVYLHPTQLYEAIGLLALYGALSVRKYTPRFRGEIALDYLLGYAMLRFVVEFYRGDADRGFVLADTLGQHISFSQGVAVLVAVIVMPLWWIRARAVPAADHAMPKPPPAKTESGAPDP